MSIPAAMTAEPHGSAQKASPHAAEQAAAGKTSPVRGKADPGKADPFLAIFLAKTASAEAAAAKTRSLHLPPGKLPGAKPGAPELLDPKLAVGKGKPSGSVHSDAGTGKASRKLSDAVAALKPSTAKSELVLSPEGPHGKVEEKRSDEKKKTPTRAAEATPSAAPIAVGHAVLGLAPAEARKASADAAPAPAQALQGAARQSSSVAAEPKVVVVDLRKKQQAASAEAPGDARASLSRLAASDKDASVTVLQRVGPDGGQPSAGSVTPRMDAPPAAHPDSMQRLRDMASSEVVKAANLVVRDGGGEIRLVLKPESLGSVRIKMSLVDNSIHGRIIVDTPAAKQIIDGSLDSLIRAFTADGFQNASVQVSVSGQGTDQGRGAQETPPVVRRRSPEGFEGSVPGIQDASLGDLLVNLFV